MSIIFSDPVERWFCVVHNHVVESCRSSCSVDQPCLLRSVSSSHLDLSACSTVDRSEATFEHVLGACLSVRLCTLAVCLRVFPNPVAFRVFPQISANHFFYAAPSTRVDLRRNKYVEDQRKLPPSLVERRYQRDHNRQEIWQRCDHLDRDPCETTEFSHARTGFGSCFCHFLYGSVPRRMQ